jgi:hypothetical protein
MAKRITQVLKGVLKGLVSSAYFSNDLIEQKCSPKLTEIWMPSVPFDCPSFWPPLFEYCRISGKRKSNKAKRAIKAMMAKRRRSKLANVGQKPLEQSEQDEFLCRKIVIIIFTKIKFTFSHQFLPQIFAVFLSQLEAIDFGTTPHGILGHKYTGMHCVHRGKWHRSCMEPNGNHPHWPHKIGLPSPTGIGNDVLRQWWNPRGKGHLGKWEEK